MRMWKLAGNGNQIFANWLEMVNANRLKWYLNITLISIGNGSIGLIKLP